MSNDIVTAGIIIIGNEVLTAKITDLNGPYLIQQLNQHGIDVMDMRTIRDDLNTIADCVHDMASHLTYVFTSGGIGPTHDDLTIRGVAMGLKKTMERNAELEKALRLFWGPNASDTQLGLADVPENTQITFHRKGFPVLRTDNVFMLPGVPSFLRACYETLAPSLRQGTTMHTKRLYIRADETAIATPLAHVQQLYPDVAIGSYPTYESTEYQVLVTLDSRDPIVLNQAYQSLIGILNVPWFT